MMAMGTDLQPEVDEDEDSTSLGENEIEVDFDEVEEGEDSTERDANGTALMTLDDLPAIDDNKAFYANLAAGGALDALEIETIRSDLWDRTEEDKTVHKARVDQYADAIKRLGLDGNPAVGADFEGASKVVSTLMIEASIDFASSAIRELMPVGGEEGGPVKQKVVGKPTQKKYDRSVRKSRHMNWQLTEQMPSFRDTLEELLTQDAMAGRAYLKIYQNLAKNRPEELYVPFSDIWLPAGASNFVAARRKTHAQKVDRQTMEERINSGMYLELELTNAEEPEKTSADTAVDKAQGKDSTTVNNEDGFRQIREIYVFLAIDSDPETNGAYAPYIVSIDESTMTLLSIYRDWDPEDPNFEPLEHIVEFPFVPWAGGPIGLPQIIGGHWIAANGALNALLDSAHLNNLSGAVALKGKTGKGGQNIPVNPGQITQIDAPVNVDDIRKLIMPLPFNQPSPVLFQLLGFLTEAGKGVVNVALEKLAEAKGDMPVGTTMALIEQGAKVYASIHARLHRAMARVLKALHQLNKQYLNEQALQREAGEILARKEDYQGPMDVVPVSDPNIFSETQRFAQIQAVAARAAGNPLYDPRKVEELILKRLKLPDGVDLLVPKPEPKKLNPINENAAAAMGQPVIAFPDQDHAAHLQAHIDFLKSPMFGQNPLIQPILLPIILPHIKDHMVYMYIQQVVDAADKASAISITQMMDDDDDVSNEMDDLLSIASTRFLDDAMKNFDELMPPEPVPPMPGEQAPQQPQSEFLMFISQMNQLMQSFMPPPPMDPSAVQSQEVQRKQAADGQKAQIDQQKVQNDAQKIELQKRDQDLAQMQAETDRLQEERLQQRQLLADHEETQANNEADILMNTADNQTAMTIAAAEIESGEKVDLSTGTGINPGNDG